MRKQTLIILPIAFFALAFGLPSYAATTAPPTSKCVTASTKATYVNMMARMQKDILPYKELPAASAAIKTYQDNMDVAWEAMQQPYCGYGKYGSASAVHSYKKNVERTRNTFLAQVKKLVAVKITTTSKIATTTEVKPAVVIPEKKIVTPTAIKTTAVRLPSGLARGVKSSGVTLLQQKLADVLNLSAAETLVTGYFGPHTETLVIRFQIKNKIITDKNSPGAGLVGPKTLAALNAL